MFVAASSIGRLFAAPLVAQSAGFWVPMVMGVLIVVAVLIAASWRRRRQLATRAAYERLRREAGFEVIEDDWQRKELGAYVFQLFTDEPAVSGHAVPLRHAVRYHADGFRVSVVNTEPPAHTADYVFPVTNVVLCDSFDVELPEFRLQPSSIVLRKAEGQGLFPRDTAFGRYNLVYTLQPNRTAHVLDEEAQSLLAGNRTIALEATPKGLLIYRHDQALRAEQLLPMVEDCVALGQIIRDNAHTMPAKDQEPAPPKNGRVAHSMPGLTSGGDTPG